MKKLIIAFLLFAMNSYAQELTQQKDKFQNMTSLSLKEMIDLDVSNITTTSDFEINIFKITKSDEVVYALYIITESDYYIPCEKESQVILLYNDSIPIEMSSTYSDHQIRKKTLTTVFQVPILEEELAALKDANKIAIKIYCDGGEFQARFRKDDLKEFKNGIKLLMK